jgi:hypothetical protein
MHQHGPTDLTGPVRGSSSWWQGTGQPSEAAAPQDMTTPSPRPEKRTSRRKRRTTDTVRHELVERVRREIEAGTYDSTEKWEAALDRLLDRLARE